MMIPLLMASWALTGDMAAAPVASRAAPPAGAARVVAHVPTQPPPPPPLVAYHPPAEIDAAHKAHAGTWKCRGNRSRFDGSSAPVTSTLAYRVDLDGAWLRADRVDTVQVAPAQSAGASVKLTSFRTYDATSHQWTIVALGSDGSVANATAAGAASGAWTWVGQTSDMNGTVQTRDYEELAGGELKLRGEALLGGTWQRTYELSCTK